MALLREPHQRGTSGAHNPPRSPIMAAEGNIKVYCRVRPLLSTEQAGGDKAGFLEVREGATVVANQPLNGVASSGGVYKRLNFDFDDVFDTDTTQEEVFDRAARSVVEGEAGWMRVCSIAVTACSCGRDAAAPAAFTFPLRRRNGRVPRHHFCIWPVR